MHDESIYAERALRAGANGYIMKHEAAEKVLVAVRQILNHEIYVSDRVASKILQQLYQRLRQPKKFSSVRPFRPGTGGIPLDRRGS